jgi:hypothetical protein
LFGRVVLTPKEAEKPRFAQHVKWGRHFGEKEEYPYLDVNPVCPFLGGDNKCRIYERRPKACRFWVCHKDPHFMEELIDSFPTHKRFLRKLGLCK